MPASVPVAPRPQRSTTSVSAAFPGRTKHWLSVRNTAPEPLHKTACRDDVSCEGLSYKKRLHLLGIELPVQATQLINDRTPLDLAFTAFIFSSADALMAVIVFWAIHLPFRVKLVTSAC